MVGKEVTEWGKENKGKVLKGFKAVWIEVKGSPRFQFWFIQDHG